MKLYLHIGTEKTGSSFIQSYLANNRKTLEKHQIHFPKAGIFESSMKNGKISPGNAGDLNEMLEKQEWKKISTWLGNLKNEALSIETNKILLSNELLIKSFSDNDILSGFLKILKELDIELGKMFLIIRNPTSQALSLYKHRSKNGVMQPIEKWLEEGYVLKNNLENFYINIDHNNVQMAQYPYKKDSHYLIDKLINHWLNLNQEVIIEKNTAVNQSLTLSELKFLSAIKSKDSFLAKRFYDQMLHLPSKMKSKDEFINHCYLQTIDAYLSNGQSLWLECNRRMTEGEILIPNKTIADAKTSEICSYSVDQLDMCSMIFMESSTAKFWMQKLVFETKNGIKRIFPESFLKAILKVIK